MWCWIPGLARSPSASSPSREAQGPLEGSFSHGSAGRSDASLESRSIAWCVVPLKELQTNTITVIRPFGK